MAPRRKALMTLLKLTDLAVVTAALVISVAVDSNGKAITGWPAVLEMRVSLRNFLFVGAYLVAWHFILKMRGLYNSYRLSPASRELGDIAIAVLVAAAPLLPLSFFIGFDHLDERDAITFGVVSFVALGIERRLLRAVARRARGWGRNLREVIIVGDESCALDAAVKLVQREGLGYRVIEILGTGSVSPDASDGDGAYLDGNALVSGNGHARPAARGYANGNGRNGNRRNGNGRNGNGNRHATTSAHASAHGRGPESVLHKLEELLAQQPIDEVFLAMPLDRTQPLLQPLISLCEEQGTTLRVVASLAVLDWSRAAIDTLAGQPVLTISSGPPDTLRLVVKRALDLGVATVGLALFLPLFIAIAIAVRLDSKGPVFFAQDRVGLNRRRFKALKFRTMIDGAELLQPQLEPLNEAEGPVFKIEADPRVTRVGRVLRRLSLDELPQLVNVLVGDMSLVGPRPLPVRDVSRIDVRWHKRRFSVKPGITCLWQINSREPKFDEWIRADMEYIDNWSLALDLKILAKTLPAVISGQGAH